MMWLKAGWVKDLLACALERFMTELWISIICSSIPLWIPFFLSLYRPAGIGCVYMWLDLGLMPIISWMISCQYASLLKVTVKKQMWCKETKSFLHFLKEIKSVHYFPLLKWAMGVKAGLFTGHLRRIYYQDVITRLCRVSTDLIV